MRLVIVSEIPVSYRTGWFRHLHDRGGLDLHVIYLAEGQPDRPWEAAGDHLPWVTFERSLDLGGTAGGHFPRLSPRLGKSLAKLEPDLVVLPGWAHPACWHAAAWSSRAEVPYLVSGETWHQQRETSIPSRVTSTVRDQLLRRSAGCLPVGRHAAHYFCSLGVDPVHIVHANTCDAEAIIARTADARKQKPPEVLYVGRLMEHKGAGLLTGVAADLATSNVRLRIIGDGPLRSTVKQLARERDSVSFDGPLPPAEAHAAMARASVVIVPSLREPWGVVVHEALACGTPVVASNRVGSAGDLITEDVGAVTAPDAGAVAAAAVELIGRRPSADACRASASAITYATATSEMQTAVNAVVEHA